MSIAIMQSPLPLRSFEHSGPMTLCACPHVLPCTACIWWEQVHAYKCNAATCVDVYQAALMRRGTPKHASFSAKCGRTLTLESVSFFHTFSSTTWTTETMECTNLAIYSGISCETTTNVAIDFIFTTRKEKIWLYLCTLIYLRYLKYMHATFPRH